MLITNEVKYTFNPNGKLNLKKNIEYKFETYMYCMYTTIMWSYSFSVSSNSAEKETVLRLAAGTTRTGTCEWWIV